MLKILIQNLFPQGQRKVVISLIAILIGLGIDQLGGGLDENMAFALIALVGIFTGGNVLEHLATVLKPLKGTKIGAIIEDILPGDQGLVGPKQAPPQVSQSVESVSYPEQEVAEDTAANPYDEVFMSVFQELQTLRNTVTGLNQQVQLQAGNMEKLIGIINAQLQAAGPQGPPPQAPPRGPANLGPQRASFNPNPNQGV